MATLKSGIKKREKAKVNMKILAAKNSLFLFILWLYIEQGEGGVIVILQNVESTIFTILPLQILHLFTYNIKALLDMLNTASLKPY